MLSFLKRHKRIIYAVGSVLLVVLIFLVSGTPGWISASASSKKLPIYCVRRDDKCISLTFDAAWGNEDTQTLIDILGKYGVKATFFVVGSWADKYPGSVRALSEAGHEVMTHSDDHAHFSKLSTEAIYANIGSSCDKIEAVTGVRPTLFRCPYGEYDDHVIQAVTDMGLKTIQWDVDSLDWKELSADEILQRIKTGVSSGSIVLFHNAAKHTPEALPGVIEYLLQNGYSIVPVSELLLSGSYEIDHTGRMCVPGSAYDDGSSKPVTPRRRGTGSSNTG